MALLGVAATAGLLPATGRSQERYPDRPIRIIVPFAAGGTIDVVSRSVAQMLGEKLGQSVVLDPRPGANGVIGAELVARAPADGYTFLLVTGSFAVNPSMYRSLRYDVFKDFTPITSIAKATGMLALVNPALDVHSLDDLVKLSRTAGQELNYASPGVGNTIHLVTELFLQKTGAKITHVPYKGNGQTVTALLANEVQVLLIPPPLVMPHVESGKLRAIAFTGSRRMPDLPAVPTMVEAGIDLVYEGSWIALFAPSGTPKAIVDRLYSVLGPMLRSDAMKASLDRNAPGYLLDGRTPAEMAGALKDDVQRFAEIIRAASIEPQ